MNTLSDRDIIAGMTRLADPDAIYLTTRMLERNRIKLNIEYRFLDTRVGFRVAILETEWHLSIAHAQFQTGGSYAETMLLKGPHEKHSCCSALGYYDTCRHDDIDELEKDLKLLCQRLRDPTFSLEDPVEEEEEEEVDYEPVSKESKIEDGSEKEEIV